MEPLAHAYGFKAPPRYTAVASHKTEGPASCEMFLGILIDLFEVCFF